jgi:hypothetical protein
MSNMSTRLPSALGLAVFTQNLFCEPPPLLITKTSITNHGIEVVLLNRSENRVIGFCTRTERGGLTLTKFFPPHHGMMPGDSFTATVPVAGMSEAEVGQESRSFAVTCVASIGVVSGTLNEDTAAMREEVAVAAFEAARISRIFTAVRDASNDMLQVAVQDAINAIARLDITLDDGSKAQGSFASGIRAANYHATAWLREMATNFETGASIVEVRSQFEEIDKRRKDLLAVTSAGQGVAR